MKKLEHTKSHTQEIMREQVSGLSTETMNENFTQVNLILSQKHHLNETSFYWRQLEFHDTGV